MAKSLLKKAKKATKSVKQKVETSAEQMRREDEEKSYTGEEDARPPSVPKAPNVNIRKHIEKLAGERRDCATIWTLIKNTTPYPSRDEVLNLIKSKGYDTLLGELS